MQSLIPLVFIGLFLYLMFFKRVESAAAVVLQTWREKKNTRAQNTPLKFFKAR